MYPIGPEILLKLDFPLYTKKKIENHLKIEGKLHKKKNIWFSKSIFLGGGYLS